MLSSNHKLNFIQKIIPYVLPRKTKVYLANFTFSQEIQRNVLNILTNIEYHWRFSGINKVFLLQNHIPLPVNIKKLLRKFERKKTYFASSLNSSLTVIATTRYFHNFFIDMLRSVSFCIIFATAISKSS